MEAAPLGFPIGTHRTTLRLLYSDGELSILGTGIVELPSKGK